MLKVDPWTTKIQQLFPLPINSNAVMPFGRKQGQLMCSCIQRCIVCIASDERSLRTYLLEGLGWLHGQGVCPALLPGTWGDLDDVRGVHADVQAQHKSNGGGFQALLLPPFGQVTLKWTADALPHALILLTRIVMQLHTACLPQPRCIVANQQPVRR